jgi:hypothetical protein
MDPVCALGTSIVLETEQQSLDTGPVLLYEVMRLEHHYLTSPSTVW